ncbi:MAG: VWA domain-containing protein [Acidobacteria bacterium]|nr:VWA domain-containing protein [Acidobacteriota bacterium]
MVFNRSVSLAAVFVAFLIWPSLLFSGEAGTTPSKTVSKETSVDIMLAPPTPERPIRVDVQLVEVNVSVIDPYNRFVTGLDKDHFRVYEDDQPQAISHFTSEDVPISIGLIFDASGSMGDKIDKARMAVNQFFRSSNPADEFFVISFNDRPTQVSTFTHNLESLQSKLNFTEAKGRTSLFDAIYLGMNEMRKARYSRKVLLIISDGGDNHSRYTEQDIKRVVREADVQIYAVGIYEPYSSRGRTPEELAGPTILNEIAEMTGGRQFPVENLNDLPDITRKISRELRNLYVIGYSPSNAKRDGKWRKIRVKLSPPKGLPPLHLFAKSGYYAPVQ